jgi:hypothetical protein
MSYHLNAELMANQNLLSNGLTLKVVFIDFFEFIFFWNLLLKTIGNAVNNEILRLINVNPMSNSEFECVADNGIDQPLRKRIRVSVSGKSSQTK